MLAAYITIMFMKVKYDFHYRRRAVQFHYAASACKPTKCPPKKEQQTAIKPDEKKVGHFDCAPCIEPTYWYYRKAELLVSGKDYGGDHI